MKKERVILGVYGHVLAWMACAFLFWGCGDDDSFSPVARDRGYDYAYTTADGLSKTPCNDMREGRDAVIGRDKDHYECRFDRIDSVYIWVGYDDTLTAEGREFKRSESSSSEESSSSKGDGDSEAAMTSSSYSSSSYSSSSYSSSSRYSSSSFYLDTAWSFNKSSVGQGSITFTLTSKDELLNPDVEYGVMTDERDGQVYRTVIVGNRVWMAENLNFAGNDDYPLVLERSTCFNFDDDNCALLGRLYSREAAMDNIYCMLGAPCDIGDTLVRGVCPKGWHIPSSDEASALTYAFGDDLDGVRSVKGWGTSYGVGTNTSGFSMPASGCLDFDDYNFKNAGKTGYVWAYIKGSSMRYLIFRGSDHDVIIHSGYTDNIFVSVRCISDDTLNIALSSSSIRSSSSVSSSSSSSLSSSSIGLTSPITEKGEQFNPDIEYGTMTDPRDGMTYKTVEVNGRTWMAENLNFAGDEDFPLQKQYSLCYEDKDENCELYGRLYSREAAMNSTACAYNTSCSPADPLQGACPTGWHIPSESEATELKDLVSTSFLELLSAKGWGNDTLVVAGEDTYGLSFIGSGYKLGDIFKNMGVNAFMWANIAGNTQRYFGINVEKKEVFVHSGYNSNIIYANVRCVKD